MYSFVGLRWGLLLLILAVLCASTAAQSGDSTVAQSGDPSSETSSSSSSVSGSGTEDILPCMHQGQVVLHGDTIQMTECSACSCDNSTLSCKFETCPPLTCRNRTKFEGICCKACPYNVTVMDVEPKLARDATIQEGIENELPVDLDVTYLFDLEATSVFGQGLWTTKMWMSDMEDGSNELSGTVVEEVLTEGQQSQDLKKNEARPVFGIEDIRYRFNLKDHKCADAKYLCAKFNKGPNPEVERSYLTFHFQAVPSEEVLTGCTAIEDCRGAAVVQVNNVEPSVPGGPVIKEGNVNNIDVDLGIDYVNNEQTTDVSGQGLWTSKMWVSSSSDGGSVLSGTMQEEVLTEGMQSQALTKDSSNRMNFRGVPYRMDLTGKSCKEAKFICAKFNQGKNPQPDKRYSDFEFEGVPTEKALTGCAPLENCQGVTFTNMNWDRELGQMQYGVPTPMTISADVSTTPDSPSVDGSGLWKMNLFGSRSMDGSGDRVAERSQILDSFNQAKPLLDGRTPIEFSDIGTNFPMEELGCGEVNYLCLEFTKGDRAKPDYSFGTQSGDESIINCKEEDCRGVEITGMEWSRKPGQIQTGVPTPLSIAADVSFTPESPKLEGTGLWKMNLFGSRSMDGSGGRVSERSQILDSFNQAKPLLDGSTPIEFTEIGTNFPMEELGCGDVNYLCLELTKGDYPNPNYPFTTSSGEDSIISCKEEECRGVFVSGVDSTLISADLYEGKEINLVQFDTVVQTTDESSPIVGRNMWRLNLYGSERENGQGPRYSEQEQVLSDYFSSRELMNPGDTLDFRTINTEYDMTDLNCKKVKFLCTEFSRNPSSSEMFELTPVPNESVLRDCMDVPEEWCNGVIIDDMDWNMEVMTDKVLQGRPTPVRFDVDVEPRPNAGSASGDALWRVGVYGATRPDGKGPRIGQKRQFLPQDMSGRDLTAGQTLTFSDVDTEFDLTSVGCESEYQYLCIEYAKGLRAKPDFKFKAADGKDEVTRCKKQPCRKGVMVEGLEVMGNDYSVMKENEPYNRVMFDLTALTTPDSGGAEGDGLWDLNLYGSNNENGVGRRFNEQKGVFNNYQKGKDAFPGENIDFGMVDTNFNMRGLTCKDVRYLCAELVQGDRPSPPFEFTPVPDQSVLKKCFRQKCDGVTIDSTDLRGDDFTVDENTNEIEFDVNVYANPNSGDASGRNLWRLETFIARTPNGDGNRRMLDRQTLTPEMGSRDLKSGNRLVFNNLAARINKDDVPCEEGGGYLCVELSRGDNPSMDYTLNGAREDSLKKCRKLKCAKAQVVEKGPPGEKGYPGEPAQIPAELMQGPVGVPGPSGPPGTSGPKGYPGMMGSPGMKGPNGDYGPNGYPGVPGSPGPPGPPGEAIAPTYQQAPSNKMAQAPRQVVQGPPGPVGLPGKAGERGAMGMRGQAGDSGPVGQPGPSGPAGPRGEEGDDGRDGSDGSTGSVGAPGALGGQGASGMPGAPGQQGHKGWRGGRGAKGLRGDNGDVGDSGNAGATGPAGAVGARGESGAQGERGERGARGVVGTAGQDGSDGDVGNAGPVGASGIMGPMGQKGHKGVTGEQGESGLQGIAGLRGESGGDGAPGQTGAVGFAGKDGEAGATGDMGAAGANGGAGMTGARGPAGSRGAAGVAGEVGQQGYAGLQGSRGNAGAQGARGAVGPSGETGSDGSDGREGESGPTGPAGARGSTGARGGVGSPGPSGPGGMIGMQGNTGAQGAIGAPGEKGDGGRPGRTGDAGVPGQMGAQGSEGRDGNAGKPGPTGPGGNDGKPGPPGSSGLQGARGTPGLPGAPGATGESGRRGSAGVQGLRGPSGDVGGDGPQGVAGPTGAQGSRGDSGPQGSQGPGGPNGQMGLTGARGAKGKRGVPGVAGSAGQAGPQGMSGDRGAPGAMGVAGPPGSEGESGVDGRDGSSGAPGTKGASGDVGRIGIPGLPGAPGDRGGVGQMGISGAPGSQGASGRRGEAGSAGSRGSPGPPGPAGSTGLSGEPGDIGRSGRTGPPGPKGNPGERGSSGQRGAQGIQGGQGPQGVVGARGEKGPRGSIGEAGVQGSSGATGRPGQAGAAGAQGARGEAGSQGAVGPGGNSGMPGPPGPSGVPGARGEVGPAGSNGRTGPTGSRGTQGVKGSTGIRGIPGPQGQTGSSGDDGRDGATGPAGSAGSPGPSGIIGGLGSMGAMGAPGPAGAAGRPGADGSDGKRGSAGQQGPGGHMGAQGIKGPTGPRGSSGRDGDTGPQGAQGPSGPTGDKGNAGAPGAMGARGMNGPGGPAGAKGERGPRGPAGPAGVRGSAGPDGAMGSAGPAGPAGARGETGATGVTGHKGWSGGPGTPGPAGPPGQAGGRGPNGRPGPSGPAGLDGPSGRNGKAGQQGPRGMSGQGGSRGSDGRSGPAGPPGPPGPAGAPGALSYSQGYSAPAGVSGNKGPNPYSSYYGDDAEIDEDDFESRIKQLRVRMMKLMHPNGEADYPARSCKDLFKNYPVLPDGYYTLDPSEGSSYDKFTAYCVKKTNATCVFPERQEIPKATYYLGSHEDSIAFSKMLNGSAITYSVKPVQLTLLRLIYSQAKQNVTYHCRNSNAVLDRDGRSSKALTLVGPQGVQMSIKSTKTDLQYEVEGTDECREHDDVWRKTTVVYTTKKTERLPLVDVAVMDVGESNQQFGINVGPVCFS